MRKLQVIQNADPQKDLGFFETTEQADKAVRKFLGKKGVDFATSIELKWIRTGPETARLPPIALSKAKKKYAFFFLEEADELEYLASLAPKAKKNPCYKSWVFLRHTRGQDSGKGVRGQEIQYSPRISGSMDKWP